MSAEELDPREYVAIGHMVDAVSYLNAARLIAENDRVELFSPVYFLLCHTLELILKACILSTGGTETQLRPQEIRHNLAALRDLAVLHGYSPSLKQNEIIDRLAPHHTDHSFRYRKTGYASYPLITEVVAELDIMVSQVQPVVAGRLRCLLTANKASGS